jgi:primosomal protein N' (replication factor Y)
LEKNFPNEKVLRIDRDSMTTKSTMLTKFADIHTGSSRLLIGTQMLAKGHHFPNVSMVGVIDADSGFFSADLRATERIGQLLIQVAGRAGRAEKKGEVWIQTRHPDHPLLRKLINEGYTTFAESILAERQQTTLPPYGHITILRSEANQKEVAIDFLNLIRKQTVALIKSQVNLLGPIPAPMERKAGRFRAQMLIHAQNRQELHRYLSALIKIIADTKMARQIRWSLDVDPLDLS